MGENTKIEWADHTFNPWIGCTKVSPACAHCYAEVNMATRTRGVKWGPGQPRYRTAPANWKKPLAWNREAKALGVRPRVFCASLADWLDDEVPIEWVADLMVLIRATQNLDWLLLTKRPQNWKLRMHFANGWLASGGDLERFEGCPKMQTAFWIAEWLEGRAPANVWMGCTVEDQERADERVPLLLSIPARVRFLSCEPLLGAVDLIPVPLGNYRGASNGESLHWIIAGGESGPRARPSHPDWFRSLRDLCLLTGAAFFFKQWGELMSERVIAAQLRDGTFTNAALAHSPGFVTEAGQNFHRVGKKQAGRLLDGREWNDVPAPGGGREP